MIQHKLNTLTQDRLNKLNVWRWSGFYKPGVYVWYKELKRVGVVIGTDPAHSDYVLADFGVGFQRVSCWYPNLVYLGATEQEVFANLL